MVMRVVLPAALIGVLLALGITHEFPAKAQATGTRVVYLGGAVFSPSTVSLTGTSTLIVSVATGAGVPAVGADGVSPVRAVVQITERGNLSGIAYTVTPSRLEKVNLVGGGRSSRLYFTSAADPGNARSGPIVCQATLVNLENNTGLAQIGTPASADVTLAVATPMPTPTPTPTPEAGDGSAPVLLDLRGDGFGLTDAEGGVNFDLDGDGSVVERVAWTAPGSDDAFLFLDRNEDGKVNNGTELFGDVAPQIYAPYPNGFAALALYELASLGGNGDGVIDVRDAVYPNLRLWQDANHNGVSEANELHPLPESGVRSISLDYRESGLRDRFGNAFRYRARVNVRGAGDAGRWAYDVFLVRGR